MVGSSIVVGISWVNNALPIHRRDDQQEEEDIDKQWSVHIVDYGKPYKIKSTSNYWRSETQFGVIIMCFCEV